MAEMDMKEKLVELLGADVCKHDSCDNCECQGSTDMCIATLKAYMADHLIQNGVTFATDNNAGSKWIPVTERLPETRGFTDCCCGETLEYELSADYLCFTEDNEYHVCCLVRSDGLEYWDEWDGGTHTVTHWMPLPEPPKEVTDEPDFI